MAHSAQATQACFGRAAAYAVYNLGVGIVIGFARTVVATYYLAKQYFYKEAYKEHKNNQSESSSLTGRLKQKFHRLLERPIDSAVESYQDVSIELWKGELYRGLIEMIPLAGTLFYTYMDNQKEGHGPFKGYVASLYGIKELDDMIEQEYTLDKGIRRAMGSENFNPIDLRFQELIRA